MKYTLVIKQKLNLIIEIMKLSIRKISVGEQCIFNTLQLTVVVDQKHIELDTLHFKDG